MVLSKRDGRLRGQLSIEFFLVLSIIIAFSVILYNVSREEVAKTKASNAVLLSKNALDSLVQAADFVALSGNGSALNVSFFVSKEAKCLYYNSTRDALYCVVYSPELKSSVTAKELVFSQSFSTSLAKNLAPACGVERALAAGWWVAQVRSEGASVNVSCWPR
jgi:uncharacterized protein (UPF0333 family)